MWKSIVFSYLQKLFPEKAYMDFIVPSGRHQQAETALKQSC
jgi:hypothetical protein